MNLETLRSLQERIRSSSGSDPQLNFAILEALQPEHVQQLQEVNDDNMFDLADLAPDLTASLDACVALLEAVLPGWSWQCGAYPQVHAHIAQPVETKFGPGIGVRAQRSGATVPLAFLDAITSAKISELEAKETV